MSTEERDGKREERDRTVIAECFKITQQVTGQETGASITMIKYTNVKQVRRRGGGGRRGSRQGGAAGIHTSHASIHVTCVHAHATRKHTHTTCRHTGGGVMMVV